MYGYIYISSLIKSGGPKQKERFHLSFAVCMQFECAPDYDKAARVNPILITTKKKFKKPCSHLYRICFGIDLIHGTNFQVLLII